MNDREWMEEILRFKPDQRIISRVAEFGCKANDGTLTDAEAREYKLLVDIGDLLATLKANVRRYLKENPE